MEPQPREPDRVSAVSDGAPIVVMGVSGSGKSTVGSALAQRLRVPFLDADALHPPANIAKMAAGEPLNDDDRYPWLEKVGEWLAGHRDGGVVACSALKRKYRDQLRAHCPRVEFLHLRGSPEVIGRRLAARSGHFMPPALLQSQFDALEPLGADECGVVINLGEDVQDVGAIVDTFLAESADGHHT
jgi:gluconokinase